MEAAKRRKICPHCTQNMSYSAYLSHKARYFNCDTSEWTAVAANCFEQSQEEITADSEVFDSCLTQNCDDTSDERCDVDGRDTELEDDTDSSVTDGDDLEMLEIGSDDIQLISEDDEDSPTSNDLESGNQVSLDTHLSVKVSTFISVILIKLQLAYRLSNTVITIFLHLLTALLTFLSKSIPALTELLPFLPTSLYHVRKNVKLSQLHNQFLFCPKCYKLYDLSAELTTTNDYGEHVSCLCTYRAFPDHPHHSRRLMCGEPLMKRVKCKNINSFRPRQIYCYCSIKKSLSILMEDCNFWEMCNKWREIPDSNSLSDIYSGRVWKEFQVYNGENFLSNRYNLAFMLNVDWFRPFDHTTHSVGVIYLTIMNLPRCVRNKFPYVLIVGVIPGPQEPSGTINTFIGPLVSDLLDLWKGSLIGQGEFRRFVRAALLCVSCDLPAARKVGGIVGHAALMGCSRCKKKFPTSSFGEKADYSGFDMDKWVPRSDEEQRKYAHEHLMATTASQQKKIEREYGVKYSLLNELPYYDSVKFLVVDPMHLLFLGIAKHTLKTWTNQDIINESHFDIIQERANKLYTPSTLGRIPLKLSSKFAQLTADQWKNWISIFSPAYMAFFYWNTGTVGGSLFRLAT